ncbi:olfactomedin-like [Micropterus salmoides]|uniref:olfactomedin-like n=1 Tax=Micropterus salmoides TaxID=27706 RepID=UPI0018ECB296|nr:olfactomedin-like [Micropterus salmoides]
MVFIREKRRGGVVISVLTASVSLLISPALNMLLLLLLLLSSGDGQAQRVSGQRKNGSCVCAVNSNLWTFPAVKFESVLQQVQSCEGSLNNLQEQVTLSSQRLPQTQALVKNMTARLEPHQYLHDQGLYSVLSLRLLGQELSQLETDVGVIHKQLNNGQTQKLSKEVGKLRADVDKMQMSNTLNMKTVKEKLRYLKNTAESCKSIPKDFRGQDRYCLKGLITNISEPVMTKVSPYGKSYISGSWGKQAQMDSEGQKNSYWVQPLLSSHIWGNSLRVYQTYEDFMASANNKDFTFAPSHSHPNSIEGPSAVLYGEALYYNCYRSADVCRYDLKSNIQSVSQEPGSPSVSLVYVVKNQDAILNGTISSGLLNQLTAELVGYFLFYPPLVIAQPLEYHNLNTSMATKNYWVITVIQDVDSSSLEANYQSFASLMEQRLAELFLVAGRQGSRAARSRRATTVGGYTVQMVSMRRLPGPKNPAEMTYYVQLNGSPVTGASAAKTLSSLDSQTMALTLGYFVQVQAEPVVKTPPSNLWIMAVLTPLFLLMVVIGMVAFILCKRNRVIFKTGAFRTFKSRSKFNQERY